MFMIKFEDIPLNFDNCYQKGEDSTIKNLLYIMMQRGSKVLSYPQIIKTKIIPLFWYRREGIKVDQDNSIYLSPQDSLRCEVLKYHYFHRIGDLQLKNCILEHIRYKMNDLYRYLTNYGDIPKDMYEKYAIKEFEKFKKFKN